MYLIDYMPSKYYFCSVYFSMCTFCTSFRNKLYLQQQKQNASHSGLVPSSWVLTSPFFLGLSPFLLVSELFSYTNL